MASIRRMPQGRWQAIVSRKGYRPQFRTFQSQPDAKHWARLIESEIDRAVFVDREPSERVTLGELIDRYIGEALPGKKRLQAFAVEWRERPIVKKAGVQICLVNTGGEVKGLQL